MLRSHARSGDFCVDDRVRQTTGKLITLSLTHTHGVNISEIQHDTRQLDSLLVVMDDRHGTNFVIHEYLLLIYQNFKDGTSQRAFNINCTVPMFSLVFWPTILIQVSK